MVLLRETYDALAALAAPDDLAAAARVRGGGGARPGVNMHIHLPPNFSAFADARQPARLAADEGVHVLGVSNFHDFTVYGEFGAAARAAGVYPLFGLELILMDEALAGRGVRVNDPQNPGRVYLCGRGAARLDAPSGAALAVLGRIRRQDATRMAHMAALVNDCFEDAGLATRLNSAAIVDGVMRRSGAPRESVYLQERHLAQAFQERLFEIIPPAERRARMAPILELAEADVPDDATALQATIRARLMKAGRPAYAEEFFPDFEDGRRLILELGAIPCYPIMADGARPPCEFERDPAQLASELRGRGIHMVELVPVRNAAAEAHRYTLALREAGFAVTAGTEHNTPDRLPLTPTFAGGRPIPGDLREIYYEGACIAAAHQFLVRAGEPGFVDANGGPNLDYADDDTRLTAFRRMGEALFEKFFASGGA